MGYNTKITKSISVETQQAIISDYQQNNLTIKDCSEKYKIKRWWINRIFAIHDITKNPRTAHNKREFTEKEKKQIIDLYLNKKRGAKYIAGVIGVSDITISTYLKTNNIKLWSRSELMESNRKHYGPTKGFSGKKHQKESKRKISKSLIKNCNRTVTGSKSQFIETIIGKVQGSYEVAYLQKLFIENVSLPKPATKVKTPYGLYFPDFEYEDRFVEIKSEFTWKVCKGEIPNPKGKLDNKQYCKIQWTHENIKPVEVIILNANAAKLLFLDAIKNKNVVTENIIYKNGKYYKESAIYDRDGH